MQRRQIRLGLTAAACIAGVWLVCWAGIVMARNSKMTEDKVRKYVHSIDFNKLSPAERRKALLALADKLNALTREERLRAHLDKDWKPWFRQMSPDEKETFIEATLPTDMKQMIESFEKLPDDKRKKTIEDALKNMRKVQETGKEPIVAGTNSPAYLEPEVAKKAETLGLKTFYTESSPETKAELAPLLEEVQHQMESGRAFR